MTTELAMEQHTTEAGRITPKELEHLRTVVNYCYDDERKDYESRDPEDREDHIFKSVFVLEGVVNRQTHSAAA